MHQPQLLEQELSCVICFDLFDNPVCLPCMHRFCRNCIDVFIQSNPTCPQCRYSLQGVELQTDFHLANIVQGYKERQAQKPPPAQDATGRHEQAASKIEALLDFLTEGCQDADLGSIVTTIEDIVANDYPDIPIVSLLKGLLTKLKPVPREADPVNQAATRTTRLKRLQAVDVASDSSTESSFDAAEATDNVNLPQGSVETCSSVLPPPVNEVDGGASNTPADAKSAMITQFVNNIRSQKESGSSCANNDGPHVPPSRFRLEEIIAELQKRQQASQSSAAPVDAPTTSEPTDDLKIQPELQSPLAIPNSQVVQIEEVQEKTEVKKVNTCTKMPVDLFQDLKLAQQNRLSKLVEPNSSCEEAKVQANTVSDANQAPIAKPRRNVPISQYIQKVDKENTLQQPKEQTSHQEPQLKKFVEPECGNEPENGENPQSFSVKDRKKLFEPQKQVVTSAPQSIAQRSMPAVVPRQKPALSPKPRNL